MEALREAVDFILSLGAAVVVPFFVLFLGLVLRQGFLRSFRAALTIGVGFIGVNLVVGLLMSTVGPQAMAFSALLGRDLDVLDVGWQMGAAVSFAAPLSFVLIPAVLGLNLLMLFTRTTRTMDIDLWNYWHFLYAGALVQAAVGSTALGVLAALLTAVIVFKLADWTAPAVEHHFGLAGISLPHTETVNWAPLMYALERFWQRIPFLRKAEADPEAIRRRFGILGEPVVLGATLGLVLGVLGGLPALTRDGDGQSFARAVLLTAVTMAAVLVILPKMVAILMEGLIPISEGARDFIRKRFPGRDIYIGLDAAVVIGHPSGMAVALLLIPIALGLALALPGNRMLPFADLPALPFYILWAVAAARGNIVRGLLSAVLVMVAILYLGSHLAGPTTEIARQTPFTAQSVAAFADPSKYPEWSGVALGSHLVPWILVNLMRPGQTGFWLALGAAILFAGAWWWVRRDIRRRYIDVAAS